ncbi:MAG: bifunctional DNA primase/polymerase [Alphaproteobacteria bacterium]
MPNKDNRTSNTNNRSKKSESSKPASADGAYRGLDLKELAGYDLNFGYTFIVLHQPGSDRSKTPLHKNWQKFDNDRFDPREWMRQDHNIGIRIDSGLLVIDADPRNYPSGDDSLERLLKDFGLRLLNIPHVITGGGGYHLYFRLPTRCVKLRLTHPRFPGIEFKTSGQVVAAGSVHPNGKTYEWGLFSPACKQSSARSHQAHKDVTARQARQRSACRGAYA